MPQHTDKVARLIEDLKHRDPGRRADAATELGELGEPEAVLPLCRVLRESNAWDVTREMVRDAVAVALVKIGAPSVPALCEMLKEESPRAREWAVELLGKIGDAQAVKPLCEALRDARQWNGRYKAAEALGRIGAPAIEPLCEALQDARPGVRCVATATLGRIGDRRAVPALCAALWDEHWPVRCLAAAALGKIGDCDAIPALCEAVAPGTLGVDWHTAGVLSRRWDWLLPVLPARRDGETTVRASAVEALSRIMLREPAAEALAQLGTAAVLPLCEVLQREDPEACCQAARMLGRIAEQEPVPELRAALPMLRRLARRREPDELGVDAYRTALERIEAATAAMDLPLPAAAPPPSPDILPIPATSPVAGAESLPIPATAPARRPEAALTAGRGPETGSEAQVGIVWAPLLSVGWVKRVLRWFRRRASGELRLR